MKKDAVWVVAAVVAIAAGAGWWYYGNIKTTDQTSDAQPSQSINSQDSSVITVDTGNPWACYAKSAKTVYYAPDQNTQVTSYKLPSDAKVIAGADAQTFKEIGIDVCLGKDKNHVYKRNTILSWADSATFKNVWYIKGTGGFYINGSKIMFYKKSSDTFTEMANGDPVTFAIGAQGAYDSSFWATDKNNVYCNGKIIPGADPASAHLDAQEINLLVTAAGVQHSYDSRCQL